MKSIQNLLLTAVVTMGLSTTHVLAGKAQQSTEQISAAVQIKELDQKIKDTQTQIDELYKKLEPNDLSDNEINQISNKLTKLEQQKTDALIASKDFELLEMKEKTTQQEKIISSQDAEITTEKAETERAYNEVNANLLSIKGSLSSSASSEN